MTRINEDLNRLLQQDDASQSAKQAASLGLKYVGFGRYVDPKTNQVTHIVQNERLVPFNRAVRSNTFKAQSADDYGTYNAAVAPEVEQLHQFMTQAYAPEKYDDRELDAIYAFTSGRYHDINNRLASVPSDVPANKIERTSPDDTMPEMIASLDSAMKKNRVPLDFIVYTKIGPDYNINDFQPGVSFKFKGYRDTTTNMNALLAQSQQEVGASGRNQIALMQILVKKNSKGIYAADFSSNPEDYEFILPRGTKVEILNGPSNLVGSDAISGNMNLEVLYFDCQVKT